MSEYQLVLHEKGDDSELASDSINSSNMKSLCGLKAISYVFVVILIGNYCQMDLIRKNRWKELEIMNTMKPLWVITSCLYLFGDWLLFLTACL